MKIFRYDVTDSTNTRAREYAKCHGAHEPAVFIADGQTEGRGRRGRSFDSAKGAGLYVSFLFSPEGDVSDAVKITVKAGVALVRAIKSVFGLSVGIKWVNDIFIGGKKLAGILTEGEFDSNGRLEYAVCGIGVNLFKREFPEELRDIVATVEENTGKLPDKEAFEKALISEFFEDMSDSEMMEEYRKSSVVIGKRVEVRRISGESFSARVMGISDSGALQTVTDDGVYEELISAEVSLKIT